MSEREKQTELNSAGEPPDALNLSASESDLASLTGDSEAYTDTPELVEEEPEAGIKGADDTFSHELAKDYNPKEIPEEDRIAEEDEVKAHPEVIDQEFAEPEEVLGTMSKEDFWLLVRRFNKQIHHVKGTREAPPGDLDLNVADNEEYTPEKMRSTMERLYISVIISVVNFAKHITRLRSWNETKRTAIFCAVYFAAWASNLLLPTILTVLAVLILYEPSRPILFPPVPLSLVSITDGKLQKPPAGTLGSKDSVTGAPESHRGEAVEQEAFNFVAGIGSIVVSTATGEHPVAETNEQGDVVGLSGLDRTSIAAQAVDTKANATGLKSSEDKDKSKRPMEAMAWSKARPAMQIVGTVCDLWERFGNALSPTPPFPRTPQYVLAGVLAPAILVTTFASAELIVKSASFLFGAFFFGQPGIDRLVNELNARYPNWKELLDIRNSILRHVPTNAQLTITLLRIGEAKNAPLPPPPRSDGPGDIPPSGPSTPPNPDELPFEATEEGINQVISPPAIESSQALPSSKHPHRDRLIRFFKSTTRTGVETQLGTDRLRAAIGSNTAKRRVGALPKSLSPTSVPCEFKARYHGRRGYAMITTTATVPCVSFCSKDMKPEFTIPLAEIVGLKKVGGFGWKAKLIVGWAMERKVADALEIENSDGKKWVLTAMPGRDECFNRLIAAGRQKWEIY